MSEVRAPDQRIVTQLRCLAGQYDFAMFQHIGAFGDAQRQIGVLLD
jgi:hypothetical protein